MEETSIGGERRALPSTLWSVVLAASDADAPTRREALQSLIESYWKPAYHFIRRKGNDPETAKDLAQGFFAALLERNFLQYVRQDRGRFRTFLLTALEHFLADEHDRASALKRGGDRKAFSLDFVAAEREGSFLTDGRPPEASFMREWGLRVLSQGLRLLRESFDRVGRAQEFEALRLHLSAGGERPPSYADLAARLGVSEQDVANRIHRARAAYRDCILQVIQSYSAGPEDAREELQDLFGAFR
jgi:RNA polymerase sigma-70 factor (ECF subfamily)